ncbi:MAG: ABC transporter permease [Alphaproteobacteria bacterium]|nr:ABC transporter permease [Alphaproteobacteria bacterium]
MTATIIFILAGTLAATVPLLLAAMGELVAEKSGMLNLGVEGMMAVGAAAGFVTVAVTGSHALGLIVGGVAALLLSGVFATLSIVFLANQVAAGLAIGILGLGVSAGIGKNYEGTTVTPMPKLSFGALGDVPVIGPALFSHDIMVYLAIAAAFAVWFVLQRTKLGLIIRAVGESPQSAHSLGYPVALIRTACVLFGGAMAGIGGAYLSIAYTPLWADGMVAGRGWIVVALVVFGTWIVPRVTLGAYLFGAISLLELSIQGLGLNVPSQLLSASPYIVTIIVLVVISRNPVLIQLNSPMSLGQTYRPNG